MNHGTGLIQQGCNQCITYIGGEARPHPLLMFLVLELVLDNGRCCKTSTQVQSNTHIEIQLKSWSGHSGPELPITERVKFNVHPTHLLMAS